jgi:hypothetical protein
VWCIDSCVSIYKHKGRTDDLVESTAFQADVPEDVYGSLRYSGPPKTLKEMDEGIMAEARRRYASRHEDESDGGGSEEGDDKDLRPPQNLP